MNIDSKVAKYYHLAIRKVVKGKDGDFTVSIPVLPGCVAQMNDISDMEAKIEDAIKSWITTANKNGIKLPKLPFPRPLWGFLKAKE